MSAPLEIEVMGQRLTVRSEDDKQHVQSVARYLDEQIRRVAETQTTKTMVQAALVAALNIASDYWKLQHQQQEVHKAISRMVGAWLLKSLSPSARKEKHRRQRVVGSPLSLRCQRSLL